MASDGLTIEATEAKTLIDLENGAYSATITAVSPADGQYGPQIRFDFTLDDHPQDDEPVVLWGWASQKLNPKSKLWEWVTAITGQAPAVGEAFSLAGLIDRKCQVVVERDETDDGPRTRVTGVWGPAKNSGSADTCSKCLEPVSYYTADGVAFCESHGPKAGP